MALTLDAKTLTNGHLTGVNRSVTVAAGATILLAFLQYTDTVGATTITSCTWDFGGTAQAMAQLATTGKILGDGGAGNDMYFDVYWLANPTSGTKNLNIVYGPSTDNLYCNTYSFLGSATSAPTSNVSSIGQATETATLTAAGGEYGIGVAGSGIVKPTGYSLTGDASSNQLALNVWITGDTNGTVAAGSRTAVSNYSSGTSQSGAIVVLVAPPAGAATVVPVPSLPLLMVG